MNVTLLNTIVTLCSSRMECWLWVLTRDHNSSCLDLHKHQVYVFKCVCVCVSARSMFLKLNGLISLCECVTFCKCENLFSVILEKLHNKILVVLLCKILVFHLQKGVGSLGTHLPGNNILYCKHSADRASNRLVLVAEWTHAWLQPQMAHAQFQSLSFCIILCLFMLGQLSYFCRASFKCMVSLLMCVMIHTYIRWLGDLGATAIL